MVVCDVRKESVFRLQELNDAQVSTFGMVLLVSAFWIGPFRLVVLLVPYFCYVLFGLVLLA